MQLMIIGIALKSVELTWRAKSGTGSQEGRPRVAPRQEQSSDMRTGLGAVAL